MRAIDMERIKKYGLNPGDFQPKPEGNTNIATDEVGNKYRQEIGTDGRIHLILVEAYTGELFE